MLRRHPARLHPCQFPIDVLVAIFLEDLIPRVRRKGIDHGTVPQMKYLVVAKPGAGAGNRAHMQSDAAGGSRPPLVLLILFGKRAPTIVHRGNGGAKRAGA